jgi:hypothetical protein
MRAKIRCARPVAATVPTGQGAKSAAEIQRSYYWSIPSVKLSRQGCLGVNGDCVFGLAKQKAPVESSGSVPHVGLAGQSPLPIPGHAYLSAYGLKPWDTICSRSRHIPLASAIEPILSSLPPRSLRPLREASMVASVSNPRNPASFAA